MARSTDAATAVLDSMQVLYELGARVDVSDEQVLGALANVGVSGFTEDHAGYLATTGIVLRLMLRHCDQEAEALFEATRSDLRILGRDIDVRTFDAIARNLRADE